MCPACGKTYGQDYNDTFCACGTELVAPAPPAPPAPQPLARPQAPPASGPQRPSTGTRCLVLYGPDKQPRHYFPLTGDAVLIGRLDPVNNCFPDIDLGEFVEEATARRVSRKHALVLHARASDTYILRPLPGNTGTQVEKRMVAGGQDVPLTPGTRLVLGGVVRLKFEVM
ncbi:MAG: FHA domain-containing protein [Gemmataceae bacterium]|nr:FHA domain-containing protein [Gemmataceae bacterium]